MDDRDAPKVLFDLSRMGTIIVLGVNGQCFSQKDEEPGNRTEDGLAAGDFSGENISATPSYRTASLCGLLVA